MALSQTQRTLFERVCKLSTGDLGVGLTPPVAKALVHICARDLGLDGFSPGTVTFPELFEIDPSALSYEDDEDVREETFARLVAATEDGDTYFACLGLLHKARLKFEKILQQQPIPTIEQVGPRGLLQYGSFSPPKLVGLLIWRKWLYDLDNRASQQTGYLFESIIASAIGGTSAAHARSPVRRRKDSRKGRQVDALKGNFAYEIKLRVTIAASGQGRWSEELEFPTDCIYSGYTPVLLVLDSTSNAKLAELVKAFEDAGGVAYVGSDAWRHLELEAGPTMTIFIEKYVKQPLDELLNGVPSELQLPSFMVSQIGRSVVFRIGNETFTIPRSPDPSLASENDVIPPDA